MKAYILNCMLALCIMVTLFFIVQSLDNIFHYAPPKPNYGQLQGED